MTNLPANLPVLLRAAGLKVVEIDGWETRGRPASTGTFSPVGVLNHHTGAFDRVGDFEDDLAYARWLFLVGRSDLPAPLCQLSLSAEGVVYLGAAGRANHAGTAKASGSVAAGDGNTLYVGIEWMLSGTQTIPDLMYRAGATLNAVLLRLLGSSVQAVSCHYQTSVTGKWDIGDPNGIRFGSARVLDVTEFRRNVQREKTRLAADTRPSSVLTYQHTSMQYSDSPEQIEADVERIFKRGKQFLSGTESADAPLPDLLLHAASRHDYFLHQVNSVWVAVKKNLVDNPGKMRTGYVPAIQSFEGAGKHGDRGIVWLSFPHDDLGRITHGCSHYLTRGRRPGDPNYNLNKRLANAIGDWAREKGDGDAIVTYAGDQNIPDRTEDTFFGSPLTSFWDELGRYENTGHGSIDVIASYDRDGRVEAKDIRALDDTEYPLNIDHFLVEGKATVRHLR